MSKNEELYTMDLELDSYDNDRNDEPLLKDDIYSETSSVNLKNKSDITIIDINNKDSILNKEKENDNDNDNENENETKENEPLINSTKTPVKPASKRLYWVDCLRVFCSFLVIFIHSSNLVLKIPIDYKEHNGKVLITYCSLARSCVPLFIMISGIFFLNPEKNISLKKIYTKYIPRILKSLIFWSLYYNIIDRYFVQGRNFEFTKEYIVQLLENIFVGGGHLWYLNLTIGLYMLTPIYRLITTDRKIAWYAAIIYCISTQFLITLFDFFTIVLNWKVQFLYDALDKLLIYKFGHYLSYYLWGYLISTHNFSKRRYIYLSYLVGVAGLLLTIAFRFLACHHYNRNVHKLTKYHHFNVAMSGYGIFVFFKYTVNHFIEPLMENETIRKILGTFSDCSFGVYLFHMTVYRLFFRFNFHSQIFDPIYWVPIYAVILYMVTFICVYFMRKISFFRMVM